MMFALAPVSEAVCIASRPPERDLWIEVVSCSAQVLQEVSDELFLQALERTDEDWTRYSLLRAAKLLRERPGLLIVAREHAFADSGLAFSKRTPRGTYEAAFSDRPGEWQSSGAQPERRFFLQTAQATCGALLEARLLVVQEVFRCCDTGRGPELGCILDVAELVPSAKAPPTPAELASGAEPAERQAPP